MASGQSIFGRFLTNIIAHACLSKVQLSYSAIPFWAGEYGAVVSIMIPYFAQNSTQQTEHESWHGRKSIVLLVNRDGSASLWWKCATPRHSAGYKKAITIILAVDWSSKVVIMQAKYWFGHLHHPHFTHRLSSCVCFILVFWITLPQTVSFPIPITIIFVNLPFYDYERVHWSPCRKFK